MIPIELTDAELDAVSGGLLDNLNIATQLNIAPVLDITSQINSAATIGVAIAGIAATVIQGVGQGNAIG
jgi:hypothetical protein